MTIREQALKVLRTDTDNQRDFKFRAWSERCGLEYIGDLYWFEENFVIEITDSEGEGKVADYIITQWTGMKDGNGNDIYEGDIVTGNYEGILDVVVFGCGCFCLRNAMQHYEATYWGKEIIVKGNIFETPELLKEKTNER